MSALTYTNEHGIATIELNNPPQNRLSQELMLSFGGAIQDIHQRSDTRVAVLRSKGPDFSFGGDVTAWLEQTPEETKSFLEQGLQLSNAFEDLPVPTIVAVQGHCLGGGFELALRADVILAAKDALFGHPEATIGIFTLLGGIQRVAERVGRTRAMQWAITAELIKARKAEKIGLINKAVARDSLDDLVSEWTSRLAEGPTLAHKAHKQLLRAWSTDGIDKADQMMPAMGAESIVTEDAQGSIASAIEALSKGEPRPKYPFVGR